LTVEILQTLSGLWEERHQAISGRLDTLISELSTHQAKLGSVQLETAHQSDELQRVTLVVSGALGELNEQVVAGEPLGQQVARVFTRYRQDLVASRRHAQGMISATRRLLDALNAIAARREVPSLPPEAEVVVAEVRKLDDSRRELEGTVRELRGQIAKLEAERHELMEEVAARDRRLSRYEEGDEGRLDERLRLYREAFTLLETGADHHAKLEQVRKLERVISLPAEQEGQAVRVADRHLAEIAKCLGDLRRIVALAEDPRRYRPRLFGNRYEFKTLRGQIAALRDASRDLVEYLDRARWALGVTVLARAIPKLRAVFREMVSLVAEWRQKLGDPPPVSITISLDGGSGILALPAILASDLETVLKKKAKAGPAATSLAPILGECVDLYHRTLEQARGGLVPREEAPKRESASQAVARLAGELSSLAALCETTFAEAAAHEFKLGESDSALLADDHLLRLALQNLDGACEEFSALPNTPALKLTPLPGRGKDFDKFLIGGRQRTEWLEELGLYRVLVSG
jgi:chromosome segregation ATPase